MKMQSTVLDKTQHAWYWDRLGKEYRCCLCGAVTKVKPPSPEPEGWMPDRYTPVNDEDRKRAG